MSDPSLRRRRLPDDDKACSQQAAGQEPGDVSADVDPLALDSKESHQHHSDNKWHPPAESSPPQRPLMLQHEHGQEADRAEYCGRSANGDVPGRLKQCVEPVADATCEQDHQPSEATTHNLGKDDPQEAARHEVGEKMSEVGMETKCGQRSPPFAVDNEASLRLSGQQPVAREGLPARGAVGEEKDAAVDSAAACASLKER